MNINKKLLIEKFEEKDYSFCNKMLMESIIDKLTEEIKEKNKDFEYTNIKNLKINCFKYLNTPRKKVVSQLYDFTYSNEFEETFILDSLLHIYESIFKENIY